MRIVAAVALAFLALPGTSLAQDNDEPEEATLPINPGIRPGGPLRDRVPLRPPRPEPPEEEPSGGAGAAPDRPMPARPAPSSSRSTGKPSVTTGGDDRPRPPTMGGAKKITLDMLTTNVYDLVKFYAEITGRNAIIGDAKELRGAEVSIISHSPVTVNEAEQAIISALEVAGYTLIINGSTVKVIKTDQASQAPISVGQGASIPWSDKFVTQIIPLSNVSVSDVNQVVSGLISGKGKVIGYVPSNTLIITDSANNLRKVFRVIQELDIAAPKSRLEVVPVEFAEAAEIKTIIDELYGVGVEAPTTSSSRSSSSSSRRTPARRTPKRDEPTTGESVTAGSESKYISKVLSDERTNSLIVLANEQGHSAVRDILDKLDVDADLTRRSQIHVVKLEHAKAEDVANVLANLSEGGSSSSKTTSSRRTPTRTTSSSSKKKSTSGSGKADSGPSGVLAAFDSGMRITHDETTNSLVIIASPEDFAVVKLVIDELDAKRRQVFVDAVVLELSSDDTFDLGLAYHGPMLPNNEELVSIAGGQFNATSLGLSQDLLSGLALGVYGESVTVPFADGTELSVPAFGVVLNALKTNSAVNIVSNPNLMTLDNEEAKIVVGRKIPFPTSSTVNQLTGTPVVSYQREDVAITLEMTPRVNSEDYVTLEIALEVAEVEEDDSGLDPAQSGFITSKREVETVALVKDNQTVVLGGLVGATDTEVESKVPVLGDLPVLGFLFRGSRETSRKTNLMVFLTPHIVDDEEDFVEVMRVKEAQRQEFLRRFYGRSRDAQMEEIRSLLRYSMNVVDEPSLYRGSTTVPKALELGGEPVSQETLDAVQDEIDKASSLSPGSGAGQLPTDPGSLDVDLGQEPVEDAPADPPADDSGDGDGGLLDTPAEESEE